jgi:uncharacterized metal-binding protein YceD (DUF177 family)
MYRPFSIEIQKLKPGTHHFDFVVDDAFFAGRENSPIQKANVALAVQLDKSPTLMDARFSMYGVVELACDRCLQPYPQTVSGDARVIYSMDRSVKGSHGEDIVYVRPDTVHLDLQQEIYDFIVLQIPLKKIPQGCPGPMCPPTVAQYIVDMVDEAKAHVELRPEGEPATVDPRWEQLKKLR